MSRPKVSIVIPVYNGSNYLKQAIDSALAQTYKNIEIIIVNDGSNDNNATEKIAKSYGDKIRYFKKENGGVATALNLGIKKMTGEYFSWLSHDDMYYPEKIEQQVDLLIHENGKTIVISDWSIVNKKGKIIKKCVLDNSLETAPGCFLAFDRATWLNGCAMLIPKNVFKVSGLFDERLKTTQDYDLFNKMIKHGFRFKIIHQPLIYSRAHPKQGSLIDPTAKESSDKIHAEIIHSLKHKEAVDYYGDNYDKVSLVYDSFLDNMYKRTPAYIADYIIRSALAHGSDDLATKVIKHKLISDKLAWPENNISKYIDKIKSKNGKKRLMFCSGHWLTGGMERVLSVLFSKIKDDYDIFLLTPFDGKKGCIGVPNYVTHIKISNNLYFNHFDSVGLAYALLFDIDIVIGFMNLFEKQLDLYSLCNEAGIRTVASNNEYYFYPYRSIYDEHKQIIKKRLDVYMCVDAVLWLTGFSTASYNQYNNNGYLIPNPNTFEVKKVDKNKIDKKTIICVGRFNDYVKRVDRILRCFGMVLEKEPDARLMLVGPCDRDMPISPRSPDTINNLLDEYAIDDKKITFVGETEDVGKYYSQASLLLLTSNNEGFGMVINEAACFGLPIVCNNIPGIEDLVIDGENGYLTEQDDITSMSDRVCDILSNDNLRNRLGKNAMKIVKRFDGDIVCEKWKYLFDSLLAVDSPYDIKQRLSSKLSYKINDYKAFSKVLSNEINEIAFSLDNKANSACIYEKSLKSYLFRLNLALKYDGISGTLKRTVKKLYKKLKNRPYF